MPQSEILLLSKKLARVITSLSGAVANYNFGRVSLLRLTILVKRFYSKRVKISAFCSSKNY